MGTVGGSRDCRWLGNTAQELGHTKRTNNSHHQALCAPAQSGGLFSLSPHITARALRDLNL
jgi:hypothetical protein